MDGTLLIKRGSQHCCSLSYLAGSVSLIFYGSLLCYARSCTPSQVFKEVSLHQGDLCLLRNPTREIPTVPPLLDTFSA